MQINFNLLFTMQLHLPVCACQSVEKQRQRRGLWRPSCSMVVSNTEARGQTNLPQGFFYSEDSET